MYVKRTIFTIQTSHGNWSTSPAHMSLIINDGYSIFLRSTFFDMPNGIKRRFKILDNDFKWLAQMYENETISDRRSYRKKNILIYTTHIHITLNVANCGFAVNQFLLHSCLLFVSNFECFFFVFGYCDTILILFFMWIN